MINAADKALADKDAQIAVRDREIKKTSEMLEDCAEERKDLQESDSKWYRNTYIVSGIGATAGVLTGPLGPAVLGLTAGVMAIAYLFTR